MRKPEGFCQDEMKNHPIQMEIDSNRVWQAEQVQNKIDNENSTYFWFTFEICFRCRGVCIKHIWYGIKFSEFIEASELVNQKYNCTDHFNWYQRRIGTNVYTVNEKCWKDITQNKSLTSVQFWTIFRSEYEECCRHIVMAIEMDLKFTIKIGVLYLCCSLYVVYLYIYIS